MNQTELGKQSAELLLALREARRAIGDHYAPNDCYATGPLTGDPIADLVECPACSFIATHDSIMAKATAAQSAPEAGDAIVEIGLCAACDTPDYCTKNRICTAGHEVVHRPPAADAGGLSDDRIYDFWLYRDCMDAIRAGDMRGQFVSAARALLAATSTAPAEKAAVQDGAA